MPKEPSSPSRSNTQIESQCINEKIDDKIEQGQRTAIVAVAQPPKKTKKRQGKSTIN